MSSTLLTTPASAEVSGPTPVNLGPLTTAFSQPSYCADVYVSFERNLRSWVLVRDQACTDIGPVPDTACLPSSIASRTQFPVASYYSPGVACPIGYVQAASSMSLDKTLNWCCPTRFKLSNDACVSTPTSQSTTIVVRQCNEFDYGLPTTHTFYLTRDDNSYFVPFTPSQRSLSTSGPVTGPLYARVTAQQVVIALDNNMAFTTFSTYSSASSSISTSFVSAVGKGRKGTLSPGTIAGVVVVVVFVACITGIIWWHKQRKCRQKNAYKPPSNVEGAREITDNIQDESGSFRGHVLYASPEDRSPGPTHELGGEIGREHRSNKSNWVKLQKEPVKTATGEQELEISEASAMERPRVTHTSGLPGSLTPPDSNQVTIQSSRHVDTQQTGGDDIDNVSEGDTQMGTPRTGEISETASIVIGNLPKPEAAPRDDQIADLEHRLSELRRLKMLEEEQERREAGR